MRVNAHPPMVTSPPTYSMQTRTIIFSPHPHGIQQLAWKELYSYPRRGSIIDAADRGRQAVMFAVLICLHPWYGVACLAADLMM